MGTPPCRGGRSRRRRWRRWYQVLRAYARIRIAIVAIVLLPASFSLVPVLHLFFFFLVRCPLESIPLDSFLTLAVGRSIATSADSALLRSYTYSYSRSTSPCKSWRGKGEPDLSPLNGINKLYYACTSPWNTIPAGGLVRTTGEGFVPSRLTPSIPNRSLPSRLFYPHACLPFSMRMTVISPASPINIDDYFYYPRY